MEGQRQEIRVVTSYLKRKENKNKKKNIIILNEKHPPKECFKVGDDENECFGLLGCVFGATTDETLSLLETLNLRWVRQGF